jgi:predicted AAA+ superfamily ATPase
MHKTPHFCALQFRYCENDKRYLFKDIVKHHRIRQPEMLENLIASELMKNQRRDGFKVYFWKGPNQEEVDFVVQKGNAIYPCLEMAAE